MQSKGCSLAVELESELANPGAGGSAARRARNEALRRKASLQPFGSAQDRPFGSAQDRPRVFRLPAPVVMEEAGRRAACLERSRRERGRGPRVEGARLPRI